MPDEYNYPYEIPDFLQGQSADEIHMRMIENLPAGIDVSEGSIPWDFTRPAALEKAEMVEYELNETVKLIFPQWSYGKWLDLHGERENVDRRPANRASGTLNVTGADGTVIPAGFQFATVEDLTASIVFETLEENVLTGDPDENGMVTSGIYIQALEGGLIGNVDADTIKLMVEPMDVISKVTNPEPLTGGTEEEADADYLIRILDAMRTGSSMTGCNADYIRWSKEVPAVGQVVVDPEWNDPEMPEEFHYTDQNGHKRCAGAVRLIIVDANGSPANEQIIKDVYKHIAGTGDTDIERLMPIGAHLTVVAPEAVNVEITATVLLDDEEDMETVTQRFKKNLASYWLDVAQEAKDDEVNHTGYIRMVQVGAVLAKTAGVIDYKDLTVNGGTENIEISHVQYPVTGEVTMDEWS